jgi:hypothetical protein
MNSDVSRTAGAPQPETAGGSRRIDLERRFLPESLARTADLGCLSPASRVALNHIRSFGYVQLCGLFERVVFCAAIGHRRLASLADVSALSPHATAEPAEHVRAARSFLHAFAREFPAACATVQPGPAVVADILSHDPLAVMLAVLHFEWMAQAHWCLARREPGLDRRFLRLLEASALERSRHLVVDTAVVKAMARHRRDADVLRAVSGYLDIGGVVERALAPQPELDRLALAAAGGDQLEPQAARELQVRQRQALRWTFFGSTLAMPGFIETLDRLSPAARELVDEVVPLVS